MTASHLLAVSFLYMVAGGKKTILNSATGKESRKFSSNTIDFPPGTLETRNLVEGVKEDSTSNARFYSRY